MRKILAAATVLTLATAMAAAPSAASAQSTVGVSVTILPQTDANDAPVVVRMTEAGLQAQHAPAARRSEILRSVRVSEPAERTGDDVPKGEPGVNVVQLIAANS